MITVQIEDLPAVLRRTGKAIVDWKESFRAFERNALRDIQTNHAKTGWGGRPLHGAAEELSDTTKQARVERIGYYSAAKHPHSDERTVLFWTGRMAASTATFTTLASDHAIVDPAIAYDGPIQGYANPVEEIAKQSHGADIWDMDPIRDALEDVTAFQADAVVRAVQGGLL